MYFYLGTFTTNIQSEPIADLARQNSQFSTAYLENMYIHGGHGRLGRLLRRSQVLDLDEQKSCICMFWALYRALKEFKNKSMIIILLPTKSFHVRSIFCFDQINFSFLVEISVQIKEMDAFFRECSIEPSKPERVA